MPHESWQGFTPCAQELFRHNEFVTQWSSLCGHLLILINGLNTPREAAHNKMDEIKKPYFGKRYLFCLIPCCFQCMFCINGSSLAFTGTVWLVSFSNLVCEMWLSSVMLNSLNIDLYSTHSTLNYILGFIWDEFNLKSLESMLLYPECPSTMGSFHYWTSNIAKIFQYNYPLSLPLCYHSFVYCNMFCLLFTPY